MAFTGLVQANNLSDVTSAEAAWDNLGNGVSYVINGATVSGVVIKGADIAALNGISRVSAKDLLLLKGLTSNAQARLNTINTQTASGIALQSNALLKASPTSEGDYSINGTLFAQSLRINNVNASSLVTAPFSGSTATTAIYLDRLIFDSAITIGGTVASGTVTSPEVAIPVRDGDYIYYLKAGQL
jgi:hypothetical protein